MSLLISILQRDFAVVAGDGRSVYRMPNGEVLTASEDSEKFFVVTPSIVLGATGSCEVGRQIREIAERTRPQTFAETKARVEQCISRAVKGDWEYAVVLLGWDEVQQKFRLLQWRKENGKVDVSESSQVLNLYGNAKAIASVAPWIRDFPFCGVMPRPDGSVLKKITGRVRESIEIAADKNPAVVNKNVKSHILLPPSITQEADGPSNFSATVSVLSYRPTTNPLTATDAGSSATVSVASWTNQTSSKGAINYNSGAITALSYNTLYYIYTVDSTLSGGAVAYYATTSKATALDGAGNIYVGSILTPFSGGPQTYGVGDGGIGAQLGLTGLLLGSSAVVTGNGSCSNPTYAIDGTNTHFAGLISSATQDAFLTLGGFSPAQPLGASLTLFARTQVMSGSNATVTLSYTLNGGLTWTNFFSVSANRALQIDSVALPVSQNCGLVEVKAEVNVPSGTNAEINVYQVWIEAIS